MDVVAVDWSGAATGAAAHIWLAHVRDGELITLRNGRNRSEVIDDLISLRGECPRGLVVGLDFSFSLPAWFLNERGYDSAPDLWRAAIDEGERWLADCAPPFWGRPGRRRPDLPEHLRRTERGAIMGAIAAKSTFQIGGTGTVGTGSIRGMPHLRQLGQAGFSIWPFDPPSRFLVVEIYPRLLTGPVIKSSGVHRERYLDSSRWPVGPASATSIVDSEDAFDAAISALVMHDHSTDLAALRQATDPVLLLEGDLWRPPKITP